MNIDTYLLICIFDNVSSLYIGNFGGKHSHRKDPKGTVNCLKKIENKIIEQKKNEKEGLKYEIYMNKKRNLKLNNSFIIDNTLVPILNDNDTSLKRMKSNFTFYYNNDNKDKININENNNNKTNNHVNDYNKQYKNDTIKDLEINNSSKMKKYIPSRESSASNGRHALIIDIFICIHLFTCIYVCICL